MGVLMLNYYVLLYVCGSVVGLVGVIYVALNFLHLLEPPRFVSIRVVTDSSTMQAPSTDPESQPVWQAPSE